MIKKYSKLFLVAIASFFISSISSNALKLSLDDLEKQLEQREGDIESVYVIGNYVFTSDYYGEMDLPDFMLAARSIDLTGKDGAVKDTAAYNAMTVFQLNRPMDDDGNRTQLVTTSNLVGSEQLPTTLDISYIDYDKITGASSLTVNVNASEQMVEDLKAYGYDVVLDNQENFTATPSTSDPKTIMLSGKVYKIEDISNWAKEKQTGYYVAFEVVIPEEFKGQAQWWLSDENKLTHDGKNYAVRAISKGADTKTFDVYVDFDGAGDVYEPARYVFDYSGIEFAAKASEAKLESTTNESTVLSALASALNLNSNDFVTIDENNNVTGDIHYNPDVTVDPSKDNKTDYYIPVIVTIDKKFADTATIVTKNNGVTKNATFKDSANNSDKTIMAVIFAVADTDVDKTFTITIDLDGEGEEYEPKEYVYDYSKAKFLAKPEANVSAEGKTENKDTYAKVMQEQFAYDGNQDTLTVNVVEDKVTLTGQLVNEKLAFNGKGQEEVDGYYFQYVIEISGDATNSSITIPTSPTTTKTIEYKDYDFKDVNGVSGIVVLHKLNKDSETNQFTVTVDYDGDNKADKTYTFDYSALHLDNNSEVLVKVSSESVGESDKTTFENWGFPKDAYALTSVENNVVKGTLPYIENSKGFSGEEATGNFMVYTIELKDVNTNGKAEVKLSCTTGDNCINGWKIIKVTDSNENFSVMHRVKQNEDGSLKDIVAYVDLDGFANNDIEAASLVPEEKYLPYEIRLTFDKNIVIQKESNVDVTTTLAPEDVQALSDAYGYTENTDTLTTSQTVHETDNLPVYKYAGKISTQVLKPESGFNKLEDGFIAFVVAPKTIIPNKTTITIDKASNDGKEKVITFEDEEPFVILRRVDKTNPEIKLTVDIDGSGNEYLPYSFYINYNDVEVEQVVHQTIPEEMAEEASKGIQSSFNYTEPKNQKVTVSYSNNTITITGTAAKNKTVTGFGKDASGYYVPFSLKFDKRYEDITIKMPRNSEVATIKNFDTDTEIGVLFQVHPNGDESTATITVDLDGAKNVYQPYNITVDYSQVQFLSDDVQFVKLDEAKASGYENWMKNSYNFDSFKLGTFEVTQEGTNVTITGTSNKNTNKNQEEQYWIAYLLKLNKDYPDIEIKKPNGDVEKHNSGAWDKGSNNLEMTLTDNVTNKLTENTSYEIIVDYDGENKDVYLPVTYTIDWSGVTKSE